MTENEQDAQRSATAVAGYFNGLFSRDMDGAMKAVIVNPQATPAHRLAWALGQLILLQTVAEASEKDEDGTNRALANATRQILEQSNAVIQDVLNELELPPVIQQPQPLRVV